MDFNTSAEQFKALADPGRLKVLRRLAAMRSCDLRILEAATISIALVIFCVFWTLAILLRISFAPAMSFSSMPCGLP